MSEKSAASADSPQQAAVEENETTTSENPTPQGNGEPPRSPAQADRAAEEEPDEAGGAERVSDSEQAGDTDQVSGTGPAREAEQAAEPEADDEQPTGPVDRVDPGNRTGEVERTEAEELSSDEDAPARTATSPVELRKASGRETDSHGSGQESGGASVAAWVESLGTDAENDTMLRFTPSAHNAIDLTDSNASGLMQLLGGRKTRLSTLLNDDATFTLGAKAAANIRAKVREMREERGIDVGYLAAGVASWTESTPAGSEAFTAPVMLVPISLRVRPDTHDYELQFTAPARLNPALARHMLQRQGVLLDPVEFHRTGYVTARFDPSRTADLLSRLATTAARASENPQTHPLASLQVFKQLYISTFADLADLGDPRVLDLQHSVLGALATGDTVEQADAVRAVESLPPLDERAPADERLVLDADPDQQKALDALGAGVSAVISAPPGTGQTQTAVNAAAQAAWEGKRVLVIAERTDTLSEFAARLSAAKLGTLAVHVPASSTPADLRAQVVRAIKRAERAEPPRLSSLHSKLTKARHQLRDHTASLHKVRDRWKCSPYQAMQALAALTSLHPAPATDVRLKRSVLDNTVDRTTVAIKLKRAAELGAFAAETRRSPWFNARLSNRQETKDAYALVTELRETLPKLQETITSACAMVNVRPGKSFSEWHSQVLLFQKVQESLGRFSHDVYARDVDDLIAATAPGWWRRQHNVEMSSMARSRLRRVAKEYIRPGVSISDLHGSLVDVQNERQEWMTWAEDGSLPNVPKNLDRLADVVGYAQSRLEKLVSALAPVGEDGKSLFDMDAEQMLATVETLAEDQRSLQTLPERTLLSEQLREQGFRELLEDFAEREVPASRVADELELAWWQSAFEAMVSGDEYLAMGTGENLRAVEAEFAAADAAHISTGAQRLNHTLAVRWKSAIETHPEAAAHLRSLLRDTEPTVEALQSVDPAITQPLVPIWTTSPLGLAEHFPAGSEASFDVVLLLDAETLAVDSALGAVSRAEQVVAFGDPVSGAPKPFQVSADPVAREAEQQVPTSIYSELARVLPEYRLRRVHRGVDQELTVLLSEALYDGELIRLPESAQLTGQGRVPGQGTAAANGRAVRVEPVEVRGGRESVESPTAEVNRVVDLVFEHVRHHRNRSLAVIAGSELHAKRVADAVALQLANHAWAKPFFEHGALGAPGGSSASSAGRGERFVVAPVERAHGVVRDDVIFSLGFGRSVKGEALHEFGELSGPRGAEFFAQAVTRARSRLTVVSSLAAADLDPSRLREGAALVYELLRMGSGEASNPSASSELTDPLVLDLVDRIRARGGRVEDGFRGTLDLAACPRKLSPENPVTPVAMVSDGTEKYTAMSVRERSRQRPAAFTALGWEYMVLWTIEVFSDPVRTTEMVAEKVGLGAGPEFAEHSRGRLTNTTGPVRFGGAADASDLDSQRINRQYPSPKERLRSRGD
ncbi:DUF4011 domain-containing protein [Nesterenkonia flava]|uniref:DUF4011 domain-containing protein n=1 Tax=Nesterenkonia flava TaxID=469799 RepID=A0ABU1FQ33_9MICC|nr:DUF4011 domain-containing protein [Nesterenkonia flava]MDR5710751.1 DUF4011 domain-containing protein [Nesterenkonia flava]